MPNIAFASRPANQLSQDGTLRIQGYHCPECVHDLVIRVRKDQWCPKGVVHAHDLVICDISSTHNDGLGRCAES